MTTKTELSKAALEKGLKQLEDAARAPTQRAEELFGKSKEGTITPEERDELVKSLTTGLGARATEGLRNGSEEMNKSINVSGYLKEQHEGLIHALDTLGSHIQKSEAQDLEYRVALANTLLGSAALLKSQDARLDAQEALLKSITEKMGIIAAQPARGPKSAAGATAAAAGTEPLNKSFAGQPGGSEMSKSDILNSMSDMIHKGMEQVAGENLMLSATKFESLNQISPDMLVQVKKFRNGNKAA